ncbi:MAG: Aspartate carbamoyltransferase [Elusimicrobia bacterium]|nr:Aspartate carbamoyltransferase [Elusimicrobiota bacterium]
MKQSTDRMKDLLGLEYLSRHQIEQILEQTKTMKQLFTRSVKKAPALRGHTVALVFLEPSTRTRTSFELAAKRLSADTINIASSTSSVQKGESLIDTAKTLEAMKADFIVLRHSSSGAPHLIAREIKTKVINAGDGSHEHPTQGLLDVFTILEKKKKVEGLKVAILGDVAHSRVARSNLWALSKLGAHVTVCGPETLLPSGLREIFGPHISTTSHVEEAIKDADVINVLRLQMERQKENLLPSIREYAELFGLNLSRLRLAKRDAIVLHPGPMNRGIEITSEVADSHQSVILDQVTNGIAVRMSVLYWLTGGPLVSSRMASDKTPSPSENLL